MSISGTLHIPRKGEERGNPAHAPAKGEAKPRPERKNPATEEKRVDQAVNDSFPASDASAEVQPKPILRGNP